MPEWAELFRLRRAWCRRGARQTLGSSTGPAREIRHIGLRLVDHREKLFESLDMTRKGVAQRLVATTWRGREKLHFLNPAPPQEIWRSN